MFPYIADELRVFYAEDYMLGIAHTSPSVYRSRLVTVLLSKK